MEKLETIALIISHQDPQKCSDLVDEFCKSKDPERISKTWNVSVIPVGASQIQGGYNMNTMPVITCLIHWKATAEQAKSFKVQQSLQINKNGLSN